MLMNDEMTKFRAWQFKYKNAAACNTVILCGFYDTMLTVLFWHGKLQIATKPTAIKA